MTSFRGEHVKIKEEGIEGDISFVVFVFHHVSSACIKAVCPPRAPDGVRNAELGSEACVKICVCVHRMCACADLG